MQKDKSQLSSGRKVRWTFLTITESLRWLHFRNKCGDAQCHYRIMGDPPVLPSFYRAAVAVITTSFFEVAAQAQANYSDPQGSDILVSAVGWLQGTLLGTVATVTAVIAVATVGFMMLTGRINWRYGASVILGCFILFGASSIVAGIHSTATFSQ
jgi:type IV secretion system protein VirB2